MRPLFRLGAMLLLILCAQPAHSAVGDTTIIPLVTKFNFPGTPTKKEAKVFVPTGKTWARVVLKLKLECPCAKGKGEWDYTNTYFINAPTNKKDSLGNTIYDPIEIARFITPYWGGQPASSNYTWWWDVTDYSYLMKDSTVFSIHYDGYTSSASFSVWLEAIEGTPPYEVYALDKLWQTSYLYGNLKDPISNHLSNKKFRAPDDVAFSKLKITTTGHGGYGPQVVAEFIDKTHNIAINGTERFTQHLFRTDCGANPYWPQDGTWALQRAGWCPGDVVPTWEWDLTPYLTKGDSTRLDYNMEPFSVDSSCNGIYSIATQVMYSKAPNFTNDASLEEILAPNIATAKTRYNRFNPICGNPLVRIRNNGKAQLKSITFEYGVHGETPKSYTWNGTVDMMSTADISLPAPDWSASFASTTRQFDCRIVKTNGADDEYPLFNALSSSYSVPPTYEGALEVNFRTNLQASGQGYFWQVTDAGGAVVAERQNVDLADQTTYVDSLHLKPGCYTFQWINPSSLGLSWWATNAQLGSATLSLTQKGYTLKTFPGDCGNGVQQQFIVGILPQISVVNNQDRVNIGPVNIGDSLTNTVRISPLNSAGLKVSAVEVKAIAKGFSVVKTEPAIPSGGILTLKEGESMTITVQYKPQVSGKKSATLTISSNDIYNPNFTIPVSGWDSSVGVEEESAVPSLEVYPSTASNIAQLRYGFEGIPSSTVHCSLYDYLGREVRVLSNGPLKNGTQELSIDVSSLSNGSYFVVLRVGQECRTAPLVVQH